MIRVPVRACPSYTGCTHCCRKHEEGRVVIYHQYKDPGLNYSHGRVVRFATIRSSCINPILAMSQTYSLSRLR